MWHADRVVFFGDHVPILPNVYGALGTPEGDTEYLIWSNTARTEGEPANLRVEQLAKTFIDHLINLRRTLPPSRVPRP